MLKIYPYNPSSKSARYLVRAIGSRARLKSPSTPARSHDIVLNWGANTIPFRTNGCRVLNDPRRVANAANKLTGLQTLQTAGVLTPDFTTDREHVRQWQGDGYRVFARTMLRAHSGEGIILINPGDTNVPAAPLYTKYHKKKHEFRVHVFNGQVIDYTEKKAKLDRDKDSFNNLIRSHQNGWVYCRENILDSAPVRAEAIKACRALNLDFGAVDIILTKKGPLVLEVNCAPGLEGTTLESYLEAIKGIMR